MAGILKLTEAVSIGVHSLIILAQNTDRLLSSKDIASVLTVSEAHLAKILQQVVKAGFVDSIRGPKGGFILRKKADEIVLIDIYKMLEGPFELKECGFKSPVCTEKCSFHRLMFSVNSQFIEYFQNTTIADIINSNYE